MVTVLPHADLAEHVGRDSVILQLLDHAATARGAKPLPSLGDIDLFSVPRSVPNMFRIAVLGAPPRFLYKFSGSQCDEIMGHNPMGRFVDEMYPDPNHKVVLSYHELLEQRRPQIFRALFGPNDGQPRTMLRVTIPLSDNGTDITAIIGVMVVHRNDEFAAMPTPSKPKFIDIRYLDLP